MDILIKLTDGYIFLFIILGIMIVSGWIKRKGYFLPIYQWLTKKIKSKRGLVLAISAFTGVLPIPGRVVVSAGFLNTLAPVGKRRRMYGIIDYLSTHHYYFWSPLEKTVLVPMAVLGLSYFQFIGYIWPLIFTSIIVILFYIFFILKEEDIDIEIKNSDRICEHCEPLIDWKVILWTGIVIVIGNIIKIYLGDVNAILSTSTQYIAIAALLSFLFSFALGSSGKYAGMVALLSATFGVQYLPLFKAIDYAGYMLSPAHKCFVFGKTYFDTPIIEYYKAIGFLCGSLFIVALLAILL